MMKRGDDSVKWISLKREYKVIFKIGFQVVTRFSYRGMISKLKNFTTFITRFHILITASRSGKPHLFVIIT